MEEAKVRIKKSPMPDRTKTVLSVVRTKHGKGNTKKTTKKKTAESSYMIFEG